MVFKMKGFSGFGNSPMKVDLTKKKGLGPRATKKPFDREKFEEENKIEHDVEAKMDEYPPKYFHMDIKKNKNKNK
tara:strand:- start:1623 stop:1847 length:225 start_codon:yes stop_codon:yes gene_type:complete